MDNEKYKWNININQYAIKENNLNIDIIDAAIFDYIDGFSKSNKIKIMMFEGKVYYYISWSELSRQMPLLGIKSRSGIFKRIKNLIDAKLIEAHPDNGRIGSLTFFCFGKNAEKLFFTNGSEYNDAQMQEKKQTCVQTETDLCTNGNTPCVQTETPPVYNGTHYNSISNNNTIDNITNNNIVNFQKNENSTHLESDILLDEKKENAPQAGGAVFEQKPKWVEGHGDGELHAKLVEYYQNPNSVKYSPELYKDFKAYWTALVQNGKGKGKELWRTKDTFLVSGRLSTWNRNNFNSEKSKNQNAGNTNNPRHKDNWNAEQVALDAIAIATAHLR